jgi:pilus assembly protein CpaC
MKKKKGFNMKHILLKTLFLCTAIMMLATTGIAATPAQNGTAASAVKSYSKTIQITAGKADTVDLASPVADILVADPAIADVGTLRSNRLYIVGKAVGETNILAYDEVGNQLANIAVHVRVDDKNLQDSLHEFFPDEQVKAKTIKNNIVLSGTVSNPSVANQVRDLAGRFIDKTQTVVDLMTVSGEQQVMLKVQVLEASRSLLREYGFETDYKPSGTKSLFNAVAGTGLTAVSPFATGTLMLSKNGKFGPLSTSLQALEKDGLVNTLAEPTLTAISGETAGFLAGGEFPIPSGKDSSGNIMIEFKQFGVSLNFTPTVLSKERLALHLSTEVSTLNKQDGLQLSGVDIPALAVRRAETTVELASGGSIMIAGLIQSDTIHQLNGFPGVKDLPIIGELFKSKSFQRNENELIILVTPYLVKPFAKQDAVAENDAGLEPDNEQQIGQEPTADDLLNKIAQDDKPVRSRRGRFVPPPLPSEFPVQGGSKPTVLSQQLINNFKKTYGSKAPPSPKAGSSFGYIVD